MHAAQVQPVSSSMRSRRWDRGPLAPLPALADPRCPIGLIVLDRAILIGGAATLPQLGGNGKDC